MRLMLVNIRVVDTVDVDVWVSTLVDAWTDVLLTWMVRVVVSTFVSRSVVVSVTAVTTSLVDL